MSYAKKILKIELREWRDELRSEKYYFKGYEKSGDAINCFARINRKIKSFEKALQKLES